VLEPVFLEAIVEQTDHAERVEQARQRRAEPPPADPNSGCNWRLAVMVLLLVGALNWLLRTVPELDPVRDPCHWLARALRGGGWNGPCRELHQREIARRPEEVLEERFTQLLEVGAPLPVLADWLRWRWLAAGRLGAWQTITGDQAKMRPRFTAGLEDDT
jgi:hypothetical protein